jgi:hypothetical protein
MHKASLGALQKTGDLSSMGEDGVMYLSLFK